MNIIYLPGSFRFLLPSATSLRSCWNRLQPMLPCSLAGQDNIMYYDYNYRDYILIIMYSDSN